MKNSKTHKGDTKADLISNGTVVSAGPCRSNSSIAFKLAILFGLFAVMMAVYSPALQSGYIWDDDEYVTENSLLRNPEGLSQIWTTLTATPQYYPLVFTSFWVEYHLWGLNPQGYHLVNLLFHTLAAVLLWRVLVRLKLPNAWFAASIFLLHPVSVESVAWITERKNVLSAFFYFASALAYLRWNRSDADVIKSVREPFHWYIDSFFLFTAALLSKTTASSLPAAILLIIWWKRGRIVGRDVWPLLPFFTVGAGLGMVTSWLERSHVGAQGPEWAFSFIERCLIAGRALWFYAAKLIYPVDLTFIYPRWHIDAGVWWQWLFPLSVLTVIVLLWCFRHRLGRGPLVAVLFFCGTLFPALGFFNVYPMRYSFVADHFQYIAMVGLIVLVSSGLVKIRRNPSLAAVVLIVLATLTWNQTHIYANQVTLWSDTIAKNPDCWLAHNNLGAAINEMGQVDSSIVQFRKSIELNPRYPDAHNNLGYALHRKGKADEAIIEFQQSISLDPGFAMPYCNLAVALLLQGQIEESITNVKNAIRLKPDYAEAYNTLAVALSAQGKDNEAISYLQTAIRLKPDYVEARKNLAALLSP